MKKQPKAVYIIENGGYTELTYEEFCRREQICPLYADKLFLPLYGRLMEVSKESFVLLEQIRTLDKGRLDDFVGRLNREQMIKVDKALRTSMELKKLDKRILMC